MLATFKKQLTNRYMWLMLIMAFYMAVSFAQSTPVPLVVDTNAIFTSTNTWMTTFGPIIAIGAGISIALALLTFIANQIIKAIKSAGGSK